MKSRRDNNTAREIAGGSETARIAIVDDDQSVREAIRSLLRSVGMVVDVFASAEEFLKSNSLKDTNCLILDVQMTGSGRAAAIELLTTRYVISYPRTVPE
jgi:FixJ family two-component response regulator